MTDLIEDIDRALAGEPMVDVISEATSELFPARSVVERFQCERGHSDYRMCFGAVWGESPFCRDCLLYISGVTDRDHLSLGEPIEYSQDDLEKMTTASMATEAYLAMHDFQARDTERRMEALGLVHCDSLIDTSPARTLTVNRSRQCVTIPCSPTIAVELGADLFPLPSP